MKKINIYGSTGIIGQKSLQILKNHFPKIKVNLLCANQNFKILKKQINIFNPKYVYLDDINAAEILKKSLNTKTKVLNFKNLRDYLNNNIIEYSLLAVSGYQSLKFLDMIVQNSNKLGIVSKESIVSAGHLFHKSKYFNKTLIYPLDSEHFSIFNFLNYKKNNSVLKKCYLTASGGPFLGKKFSSLKNVTFEQASKHPKWQMGYKNSIDSATLVNKCLELIEAHYLFDISFNKLKILIHPESLVHSILEYDDCLSNMIYFHNDMKIPLHNFFNLNFNHIISNSKKFNFKINNKFSFYDVNNKNFPIYDFFNKLDKTKPQNLIKFNIGNEFAVDLFKKNKIKYTDIYNIIVKITSLDLYSPVNTIKSVINYHEEIENNIKQQYKFY